jgi:hypothetical protein
MAEKEGWACAQHMAFPAKHSGHIPKVFTPKYKLHITQLLTCDDASKNLSALVCSEPKCKQHPGACLQAQPKIML